MSSIRDRIDHYLLLVVAFSLFAWAPLLTPAYFFQAHDAPHSVFYLVEFDQTLRDGYLWPRWAPDFAFGYGYPLFNILAPLAIYAAEILHLLGLSFVGSVKAMYALGTIGAGLAMYVFVRRLFGREAGLLAAVAYMYVPFHLVEIFVRSAYSEFIALALLPLILYAFTELVAAPSAGRTALAGLVYGVLILTHVTTFFTFTPFLVAYIAFLLIGQWRNKGSHAAFRAALYTMGGGVLGLALSAIYLVPMLAELRHVKIEQWTAFNYDYGQHFVYFSQLLSPLWDYGYSGPGLEDGMSFQLGAVTVVLLVFGGWRALAGRFPHRGTALFFLAGTAFIVWLMSPAAQFAWRVLPVASLVQFPWRLLGLTALTTSVVAGSLVAGQIGKHLHFAQAQVSADQQIERAGERESKGAGERRSGGARKQGPARADVAPDSPISDSLSPNLLVLLLVIILGSIGYLLPQYTPVEPWRERPEAVIRWSRFSTADRVAMVAHTDEQPTTSPMESQYLAGEALDVAAILDGAGTIETLRHGGASDEVLVNADGPVTVQFYTYDYPGWRVTIDGRPAAFRHEPPYGLITVDVPDGEHHVALQMGSTPPRIVGGLISLAAALTIGIALIREYIWTKGIAGQSGSVSKL
jgi:hypothetical protein